MLRAKWSDGIFDCAEEDVVTQLIDSDGDPGGERLCGGIRPQRRAGGGGGET